MYCRHTKENIIQLFEHKDCNGGFQPLCKRGQLGLYYYMIKSPKSIKTRPTGALGSIEYVVDSWNSNRNNYSAVYSKRQRPARTTDLE